MNEIIKAFQHLGDALGAAKSGFDLWKSVRESQATPEQEAEIEKAFGDAEKSRQLAIAEIGKAFGYQLCRCTLPPQVCLRTGYDEQTGEEKSKCPKCGQFYPENLEPINYGDD